MRPKAVVSQTDSLHIRNLAETAQLLIILINTSRSILGVFQSCISTWNRQCLNCFAKLWKLICKSFKCQFWRNRHSDVTVIYLSAVTFCSAQLMCPAIPLSPLMLCGRDRFITTETCEKWCERGSECCFRSSKVRGTHMLQAGYCRAADNLPTDFQFMTLFCSLFHLPHRRANSPADT